MAANPPAKVPLVAQIESRNFSTAKDSKMVNCFVEQVGQQEYAAVKRPGLALAFQGTTGCGQGVYNFLEVLYSVSGDTLNVNSTFTTAFAQTTASAGWSARKGVSGVGFKGMLWAMGGVNSDGTTFNNDVWNSSDGINWNRVTVSAPWVPKAYAGLIVLNNTLYMMGGLEAGNLYDASVWSTTDGIGWTQLNANAWPGRANFGLTSFGGKIWVAGGQTGGALDSGQAGSDVWSSSDGIIWVQATAAAPWAGRSRFGFAGFNGKLRVLGGYLSNFVGAGGDLWSSTDGINWTRDSSNPFAQAATGVFKQAALTSPGAQFGIAPNATLTGGAGSGATAITFIEGMEEDGADDYDGPLNASIPTAGSGYTSAPTLAFTLGGGIPPTGYTFLNANGVAGDKRGMFVLAGANLYFFTFFNNGAPSNEIWQSSDGVTWTIYSSNPAYGARDSTAFFLGSFWILSGVNAAPAYLSDVWKGNISSGSTFALTPTVTCLPMSFNQTSATLTNPLLFFKSNKDAYTYNANLTSLAKVTNANYPATTVPGIAYVDGYFFVMDSGGRIWNSSINDPSTWSALGFIPMQGEPNGGMALGKVGQYIVALGVWSTQFFYDNQVPAPASPLAVNSSLDSLTGCASGDSLVQMQSTIVWLGQNRSEGRGIFIINNLIPTRISTPYIDRILEADSLASVRAFATVAEGHSLYVLTLVNTNITLVYDFSTHIWYVWTSRAPKTGTVITSLTSDSYGMATAISLNHGLTDGDPVTVSGATVAAYNIQTNVSVTDANTFTYSIGTSGAASASGATVTGSSEGYFIGRGSASLGGNYFLQHETNGAVYQSSMNTFDDFGNPIDVRVRTGVWDGGSPRYKTFPNTSLIADNNNSSCIIRYTNDDYNTFSLYRSVSLAIIRKHLSRSGRARRRAWEVRHTASTAFRAFELLISIELGEY